ncbi:hypothetical protein T265_08423 [Opisthorchis viverrini]|uniref:Uncharacterized protein n=1 Tax=Opisthorchis viverrini TaxID=6198 RepID=A0A074Z973_OPIVI|nr:hypothetical protein T265_08423 [Opisthorchis viverrini]KER23771.1 hypothetical protein T265_08423 [Opisthorchis viverrini]
MIRSTFSRITRMDFQTLYGPTSDRSWNTPTKLSTQDARKTSPSLSHLLPYYSHGLPNALWAYVRPLLEYANQVVYSGRTKDVTLIERVQRAATRVVAGLKSVDSETRLAIIDLFPLEHHNLRGKLVLTYALFEQSFANRSFTVGPANTRRGHSENLFKLRAHIH